MNIPLCKPDIGEEEIQLIREVLESGWLAHGPKNQEFEKSFADYIGVEKAVSLNSCASALHLAILANDIKGEVLTPSFTFPASTNAIVTAGAKPVFLDIDYDTCNIDPQKIEERITSKTHAIMPVHFAGQACDMKEIMEIAEKHNLVVIEDSAETLGGTFNDKKTGSFGIGCFSFYPTKNITTGEGGMITTNDLEFARKVEIFRGHGISSSTFEREKKEKPWLRAAVCAGYNFRLCDILAAIGIVQLKKIDIMNDLRRKHSAYLNKQLSSMEGVKIPVESSKCKHVYQMYTIKLADNIDRTGFIMYLREKGIGANVHFDPPVHLQPYYTQFNNHHLDVTEKVAKTIVTLPMYPGLKQEELDYMVEGVEEAVNKLKKN